MMNKAISLLAAIIMALAAAPQCALAQSQDKAATPEPGEYISDGGWGNLSVTHASNKDTKFRIDALGANGHSCELDGEIRLGIATLDSGEKGKPCRVQFTPKGDGFAVKPLTSEECRYFCGMRATFDALYTKAIPGCENTARAQTRKKFKQLYDSKKYDEARQALEPLLSKCEKTIVWSEIGAIRNDLAITQYHLHDYQACLDTLQPYNSLDAIEYGEGLKSSEPSSAEIYAGIIGPAQHNIKLCEMKVRRE